MIEDCLMKNTDKKVVVQIVQHLRAGGIECLVLEMMRSSLMSDDEDMHIISLEGSMEEALLNWPRLLPYKKKLHFINKQPGLSIGCLLKIKKLLTVLKTDVVHSHHIGPLLYGGIAAKWVGIECRIHTEHDAWHMEDHKRRRLESMLLNWVRPILVADAQGVQKQLASYQPSYPTQVIHNGVDCKLFHKGNQPYARAQLGLVQKVGDKAVKYVGCAGRLTEVKGHRYLIDALKFLKDECILVLAGEGEYRPELELYIQQSGLKDRVILLGNIDNMVYFYQSLDVFCLPSLNEGLPLSPLEAQACGIPVILTDVGGCREACCPESGVMVPAKDGTALAWAIRQTLSKLSRDQVPSPRKFVTTERDFSNMLDEYRLLYQQ
jgi:glycosyltransferase involved in cell wall biosynthesis